MHHLEVGCNLSSPLRPQSRKEATTHTEMTIDNSGGGKATIQRFPRLPERAENRIAELDAIVFRSMAQQRKARIEMGRALNELKKILGHSNWQPHFAEMFAPRGLMLRTAERYMKLARKEDHISKIGTLTIFKPTTDQGAQDIRAATGRAQAEVAAASGKSKTKKRSLHLYRLALRMTDTEHAAMDVLRKLPEWPRTEERVIGFLKSLCVEFGILKKESGRRL
jgi:hypothetical protein